MKTIIGFMGIDAPAAALNNSGQEAGAATENTVAIKKIQGKQGIFPYVSGQAVRYWWRQTLQKKFGWDMSPISREEKIAFTVADPAQYPDDDIFGYMRAKKIQVEKKGKTKSQNVTVTRLSPLKNSTLVSVSPIRIVDDFGVMSRQEGDPVPYEHEFAQCIFKGLFSLDVDEAGTFYYIHRTGYQNIREEMLADYQSNGNVAVDEDHQCVKINSGIKKQRIEDTIKALPYLFGGAKQTLHLTNVSPALLVLVLYNGGNHILANLMFDNKGVPAFSLSVLEGVAKDYKDDLLSKIYIGRVEGFLDEISAPLEELATKYDNIVIGTPKSVVDAFLEEVADKITE
jgi:CRISPR-associated protein Cst2